MLKRVLGVLMGCLVAAAVFFLGNMAYVMNLLNIADLLPQYAVIIVAVIIGIIFYFSLSSYCAQYLVKHLSRMEDALVKMNIKELLACVFGCLIGLAIANLIGIAFSHLGIFGTWIVVILNLVCGYLGFRVAGRKKDELNEGIFRDKKGAGISGKPKILDTSVIIDGRILDILQTGFIEGKIIIPNFVLDELRHIADSSDALKRNRGRSGFDILNEIQKQLNVPVEIVDYHIKEVMEVDSKLLKMGADLNGFVVTNDFNLNKVAEFQGVKVLNINELANAVKPVVLPGEEMRVTVIKEGKENSQGIAYLNDGTMIVVEGGKKYIGETITAVVTSILQTAAGRMIFVKKKD